MVKSAAAVSCCLQVNDEFSSLPFCKKDLDGKTGIEVLNYWQWVLLNKARNS